MNCISCNKKMHHSKLYRICITCMFNKDITISHNEAKKRYRLTSTDIRNAKLYRFKVRIKNNMITKHLVKEVHELARKLFKNLDLTNTKLIAFNKCEKEITTKLEYSHQKELYEQNIKNNVIELLSKYDINKIDIIVNKLIDYFIKLRCTDFFASSESSLCVQICDDVHKCYQMKILLDNTIINQFGEEYMSYAQKHSEYFSYICGKCDSKCIIDKLHEIINKEKRNQRQHNIDELLKDNLNKDDIKYAKNLGVYGMYIHFGDGTLETIFNEIKNEIKN